jgi:hypothetical protein
VTCPAGYTVAITPSGRAVFDWRCGPCPLRERCTRAKDGKTLNLGPHEAETGGGPPPRHRPGLPGQLPSLVADG